MAYSVEKTLPVAWLDENSRGGYHINYFHTLLEELYPVFGNLVVFLP